MLLFDILKSWRYVSINLLAAAVSAAVFHWPEAFQSPSSRSRGVGQWNWLM